MDKILVSDLATAMGATLVGDASLAITGAAEPQDAGPDDIAIAASDAYAARLGDGQAKVALMAQGADWQAHGLSAAILMARPRFAMVDVTRAVDGAWRRGAGSGIHPTAIIDPTAQVPGDAVIGPFSVIGANTTLGHGAHIGSHVSIRHDVAIGPGATILDGVKIGHGVDIGANFVAHYGVVVGSDGFSFVTAERSGVESVRETLGDQGDELKGQSWHRIHSLGAVSIGDDVELGANTCIDRGTIRNTTIGNRTKFDNLVHIGHNVQIGNDCLICGQVGIAGSSRLGNNVVLAGQTGITDNIFVGDNVVAGGATKVMSNVPAGRVMLGYPAVKMDKQMEMYKALRKLPKLLTDVANLKKRF